jgi:hypothetical protein
MTFESALKFIFITGLMLALSALAYAGDPVQPDQELPTVIDHPGQPITFKWNDQYEATLKVSTVDSPMFHVPAKVNESFCGPNQGMVCTFDLIVRQKYYFLAWSKNPDPSKINERLRAHFPQFPNGAGDRDLEVSQLVFGSEIYAPKLRAGLPPTTLTCGDYSWLPTGTPQAPNDLRVTRWDTEFMLPNPETSVNENRILEGAMNVDFKKNSQGSLTISNIGYLTLTPVTNLGLIIGDVLSWSLKKSDGETCQASLIPDIASLRQAADVFDKNRIDPKKETNLYRDGDDEALKAGKILSLTTQFESWSAIKLENVK